MPRHIEFHENMDVTGHSKDNGSLQESAQLLGHNELVVWIDAIHARTTLNYTTYPAHELKGDRAQGTGVYSWTDPYEKPVLTHHQSRRGEPVGRVIDAQFIETSATGEPANRLKVRITDADAIEKIQDGRYQTVSIGGRAEHAYCSICSQDWLEEGFCEHWPGDTYEGETCHLIFGELTFREVSFVNVPADEDAQIVLIEDSGDGEEHTVLMEKAIQFQDLPTADKGKSWDADGARERVASWAGGPDKEDIDWSQYRKAFFWYDADNEGNFTACKLPFADVVDGELRSVWRGVSAAMEAVNGVHGGVDIPEDDRRSVYNHIVKYYEKFDEEPPEFKDGESRTTYITHEAAEGGRRMPDKMQEKIDELTEKLEVKEEKISVQEQTIQNKDEEIARLTNENENLSDKVETLEGKVENLNSEVERLTEENTNLRAEQHQALAEDVVDMKIALGRAREEDREDLVTKHVERTYESLQDTCEDLQYEQELLEQDEEPVEGDEVDDPTENVGEDNVDGEDSGLDPEDQKRLNNLL